MNPLRTLAFRILNRQPERRKKAQEKAKPDSRLRADIRVDGAKYFGIGLRSGLNGEAVVMSPYNFQERGISHITYDKFGKTEYLLNLEDAYTKDNHFVDFMFRKTPLNVETPNEYIDAALAQAQPDGSSARLLNEYRAWMMGKGRYAAELLVITKYQAMVQSGSERKKKLTSALHGKMVMFEEFGPFAKDWLFGIPISWRSQSDDPIRADLRPIDYAVPQDAWFYETYWVSPTAHLAYAAFTFTEDIRHGDKDGNIINTVLDEVDYLILNLEDHDEFIWGKGLAIVTVRWKEGENPDFGDKSRTLASVGLERVTKRAHLEELYKSLAPGGRDYPGKVELVQNPKGVFSAISGRLTPYSEKGGNLGLGLIRGETPAFVEYLDTHVNFALFGKTKEAGKTTYGGMLAFVASILAAKRARVKTFAQPNVVYMNWSEELDSSIPYVVSERFHGKVHDLSHLQDAYTYVAQRANKDGRPIEEGEVLAAQKYLHERDREEVQRFIAQWKDASNELGRLAWMPLTFFTGGVNERRLNWMTEFLIFWPQVQAEFFYRWGIFVHLVGDNCSAWRRRGDDPNLGNMPMNLGKTAGLTMTGLLTTGRNQGILTWLFTHQVSDLNYIATGVYNNLTLAGFLELLDNGQRVLRPVVRPARDPGHEDTVVFDEVEVHLEGILEEWFRRREGEEIYVPARLVPETVS